MWFTLRTGFRIAHLLPYPFRFSNLLRMRFITGSFINFCCSSRSINWLILCVSCFMTFSLAGQNTTNSLRAESFDTARVITIKWLGTESYRFDETEVFQRLIFEGVTYPDDQRLPVWYRYYAHRNPDIEPVVSVVPVTTDRITDAEAQLLPDPASFGDEFAVRVVPSMVRRTANSAFYVTPIRRNRNGELEKLLSFRLEVNEYPINIVEVAFRTMKSTSVLASGTWHRMRVSRTGVFRVDYQQLSAMGLAGSGADYIGVYGMGGAMLPEHAGAARPDGLQEVSIVVVDGGDNSIDPGDYVLFYGEGPGEWVYDGANDRFTFHPHLYDLNNFYYFTRKSSPGLRIQQQMPTTAAATHQVNTFIDHFRHENDSLNLLKSGKTWVGEVFDHKTSYQFDFQIANIDPQVPVEIYTSVVARSLAGSSFTIQSGQHSAVAGISPILAGYNNTYANTARKALTFNTSGNNIPVIITYSKPLSSSVGWLDYLEVNLSRELRFSSAQLRFRQPAVIGAGNVAEYLIGQATSNTEVWDVTNPFAPEIVSGSLSGSQFSFKAEADQLRQFIGHNGTGWFTPEPAGSVANQNLRSTPHTEMVIVSHPDFLPAANRMKEIHNEYSGLSVMVVTPSQVYHEFSSGKQDPAAIRDFMKMLYDRAATPKEMPKYLLLLGDGSFDNLSRTDNNTNFIPTFQSLESFNPAGSWVTDDFYGMLDDHEGINSSGALDLGIGRFPVGTLQEAMQMVDKIERYISDNSVLPDNGVCSGMGSSKPLADWRNAICIVADDEDSNLHVDQADILANYLDDYHTVYQVNKLYLDAYQQVSISGGHRYPEVNAAINKQMEQGVLIMNYIGHGGELGWAHERVLRIEDIQSWRNTWSMPLFLTSTCEFSRFDDPSRRSAGEYTYLHPNGGAIALFTTTRLAFASTNYMFNTEFYKQVFDKPDGNYQRLGDIFKNAKIQAGSQISNRNMVLLGDPALMLAYPKHQVITTHINDSSVTQPFDTLKALSKITVMGAVVNNSQQVINDFNGTLYPIVYDKAMTFTTLANDGGSYPKNFTMQNNILYRGKVSVDNGQFSFSFYVPKDISYAFGNGKISYYAEDGSQDAHGFFNQIVVGGTAEDQITDDQGPEIRLYLNDTSFVFGGTTDANPVILALMSDKYGINTAGAGIGHDITAVLNENSSNPIVLNDYYESDMNSYNSGRVVYSLNNIDDGPHRLKIKAWDILNNSSEAYTEFIVASADVPVLSHVLNYPNPFTTYTEFWFEHNQPCCELDVMIQVFTVSGRLVKTIRETVSTTGYRASPIPWNGLDEFGDRLARGVYVYKVTINTKEMKQAEKYEKLFILR